MKGDRPEPLLAGDSPSPAMLPPGSRHADYNPHSPRGLACAAGQLALSVATVAAAVLGALWQWSPAFSGQLDVRPPLHPTNDASRSVYFGMGCFWHTQYDTFLVERAPPFSRMADAAITSLVGYAGGKYMSRDGYVCYHNGNPATDYDNLGHTEVVEIELAPLTSTGNTSALAVVQFEKLAERYFQEGFVRTPKGVHSTKLCVYIPWSVLNFCAQLLFEVASDSQ
jgi:hypothetical protein